MADQVLVEIEVTNFGGELSRDGRSRQSYAQWREIWPWWRHIWAHEGDLITEKIDWFRLSFREVEFPLDQKSLGFRWKHLSSTAKASSRLIIGSGSVSYIKWVGWWVLVGMFALHTHSLYFYLLSHLLLSFFFTFLFLTKPQLLWLKFYYHSYFMYTFNFKLWDVLIFNVIKLK